MKKLIVILGMTMLLVGCNGYDDSALSGRVNDLENRIAKLEELCKQMNTNISSLQTIVNALQQNDYITNVTPITKDGATIGYTITFAVNSPITIYHGQNGETPAMGIKQDIDDIYYWTLNSEWLTDESGNKIKAQGPIGQDGITPVLKIESGYWFISYNNGVSWVEIGTAVGDSIFRDVVYTEDNVIFELNDGTFITIPKSATLPVFNISFDTTEPISALPNNVYEINYTLIGADENTVIEFISKNGYSVNIVKTDNQSGKIIITTPDVIVNTSIIVLVNDGYDRTIMRFINFAERQIIITTDSYTAKGNGNVVPVVIKTNVNYTVLIDEAEQSWISVAPATRAAVSDKTVNFLIEPNPDFSFRYATVKICDPNTNIEQSIFFIQEPIGYKSVHLKGSGLLPREISTDEKTEILWLEITGYFNDSECDYISEMPSLKILDISGIDSNTLPNECFMDNTSLETVVLPSGLTDIPGRAFCGSNIKYIDIPETTQTIGMYAFQNCKQLSGEVFIPESVTKIMQYAFDGCENMSSVRLPSQLQSIDNRVFRNAGITSITIPASVKTIESHAFYGCTKLSGNLILPEGLLSIEFGAFGNEVSDIEYLHAMAPCNQFTGDLIIPDGIELIQREVFTGCGFDGRLILGKSVKKIGYRAFAGCQFTGDLVIPDSVESIGAEAFLNCTQLTGRLIIGENIKQIYGGAFFYLEKLPEYNYWRDIPFSKVYVKALIPPTLVRATHIDRVFFEIKYLGVPTGTMSAYKTSWKTGAYEIKTIEEIDFNEIIL